VSENLSSDIEQAAPPVPNTQIQGENHAKDKNYNPFPTINMVLGTPNTTVNFKCDIKNKSLYTVQAKDWNPVHPTTIQLYEQYGKVDKNGKAKYTPRPEETAEQKVLDNARFPDGTFKYYISYTTMKRMMGADGVEYLVRYGYLHGISVMNKEWKYFKRDFDFHYEPVFDPQVGDQTNFFQMTYGEQINSIKKYHTPWDKDVFERSLKDIPFPGNSKVGVSFKVGVEGSMGTVTIPSIQAFRTKSFEELYEYARTGDNRYLDVPNPKVVKK
jgi:hypothetical protein